MLKFHSITEVVAGGMGECTEIEDLSRGENRAFGSWGKKGSSRIESVCCLKFTFSIGEYSHLRRDFFLLQFWSQSIDLFL